MKPLSPESPVARYTQQRRKISLTSVAVCVMIAVLTALISLSMLYNSTIAGQRERLGDSVDVLARLLAAVNVHQNEEHPADPHRAAMDALKQVIEAHRMYDGFGQTGEFLIARTEGDYIHHLLSPRQAPTELLVPRAKNRDVPMQQALQGESGVIIATDYRGVEVLAAYRAIPSMGVGLVAKIDMKEIRAPFVRTAIVVLIASLLLAFFGLLIFRRLTHPLIGQLQENERRYRTLFELSPYGVLVIDPVTGNHVAFNKCAYLQLGYDREGFLGLRAYDYSMEPAQELEARFARVVLLGHEHFVTRHRTREGELRDIEVHMECMQLDGRSLLHAIYQDITERVLVEEELAQHRTNLEELVRARTAELETANQQLEAEMRERVKAEAELRMSHIVYQNTVDGVFVTDVDANILAVNPAFTKITGFTAEEAIGRNPRLLKSHHQGPDFYQTLWNSLLEKGEWRGELWNRRKNGEAYLQQVAITMFPGEDGKPKNYVAVFSDITDLREKEERIHHQAYHDALTDLPNRLLFGDRLEQALAHARRHQDRLAVMFLDLDRFKVINDTLGHNVGDQLLQEVARRLTEQVREEDTISRFGGDEFVVLLTSLRDASGAELVASKFIETFARPVTIDAHELNITTSIGIALYPEDGSDTDTLLKNADAAMYRAKEQGRNSFQFYTPEINHKALDRLAMEGDLRHALERGEFELHYQPRVWLPTGAVVGMEALIRWRHPERGMVSPAEFIPIAEETGLIIPIGQWVIREACVQAKRWHDEGFARLRVSVNISARQFNRSEIVECVDKVLAFSGIDSTALEFELTESLVMRDPEKTIETLRQIKERGIAISVDDFGTGYSSLSYLKRFPIDVLKIDRSFISDIGTDPDDAAIAETIIALGHSLRMEVVAEGVETEEQLSFLEARQCLTVQGFYFSRPLPAAEFGELLRTGLGHRMERYRAATSSRVA